MLNLYVAFCNETTAVMILDCNVLCTRLHLWINRECDRLFIIIVNYDWIFEKIAQHRRVLSLKIEHELNILYKNHRRQYSPH